MNRIYNNPVFISVIVFTFASYLFSSLAFIVPQWYAGWPGSYNSFQNIGLWEICFYSFMQEDVYNKIYSDCFHLSYSGISDLYSWIVTSWFMVSQILFTINYISLMLASLLCLAMSLGSVGMRRRKYAIIIISLHCISWLTCLVTLILFGTGTRNLTEDQWMPNPDQCHLSWSYGAASLSLLGNMICIGQIASALKTGRNGIIFWSCSKMFVDDNDDTTLQHERGLTNSQPGYSVYDPRGDSSSKISAAKDRSILSGQYSIPFSTVSKTGSQHNHSLLSEQPKKPFSVISKTGHSHSQEIPTTSTQPSHLSKRPVKMTKGTSEASVTKSEHIQHDKNPARVSSPPASQLTVSHMSGNSAVISARPMKKK